MTNKWANKKTGYSLPCRPFANTSEPSRTAVVAASQA